MRLTVAICTWNRADLLEQTLAGLTQVQIPDGVDWELLVVNNNSTDHTEEVLARFTKLLPLRKMIELKPGIANARNCAASAAQGELLIFADDDVIVDVNWLRSYVSAFSQHPEATFGGGTIIPRFAVDPPRWAAANLDLLHGVFGIRELGPGVRHLEESETVFGANMVFKTSVIKDLEFNPLLGHINGQRINGEETEMFAALRRAEYKGLWVGTAIVKHHVPPERMTVEHVRRIAVGYGRYMALRETAESPSTPTLFGRPRWALKKYLRARLLEIVFSPLQNRRWLQSLQEAAICSGIIEQHRAVKSRDDQ